MKRLRLLSEMAAVVCVLSACVVGQSLDMEYQAEASDNVGSGIAVAAQVNDERPYVTSGDKAPHYIGKYRAGFGIPYDVSTDNDEPLAGLIERDLRKELQSLGFSEAAGGNQQRGLEVSIEDWNFDAYQNGKFNYALSVKVVDGQGQTLVDTPVGDEVVVKGTFWTGGKGGFEKAMPGLYRDAILSIVRDNPEVLKALGGQ